jgi:hypothetical protein
MVSQHRWSFVRSGFPVWGALVLVCAGALPLVSDQGRGVQVVVVSVSGDWTPVCQAVGSDCKAVGDSRRPVRFGETLTVGAICLFGTEQGSLVLKYATKGDDALYPFPCDKANLSQARSCSTSLQQPCSVDLRTVGKTQGRAVAFMATISDAFRRMTQAQPEKYMVAASRGAEAELADAVVPLESGRIDLRAAFRDMDPGTYYVELASVSSSASPQGPPVRVSYAKGQAVDAPARGARGGLYKLALVTETGGLGDSDCWILVAAPPEYAKQAAAYDQAVSESTKLPAEMDAGATRALLRAYLESLANPRQERAAQP